MPKMGESVSEATIISWTKDIGETIELDETIVEIATDKVDSEVPSTHEGKLIEKLFEVDEVVQVGQVFVILESEQVESSPEETDTDVPKEEKIKIIEKEVLETIDKTTSNISNSGDRFYSPLVRSIASEEGIEREELESISGTGKDGRVTKTDMINYIKSRSEKNTYANTEIKDKEVETKQTISNKNETPVPHKTPIPNTGEIEIVEMDRMRKLISSHMTMSKATSAHITSMVEVDMTNIVNWRNSIKEDFKVREKQNITFTPIIIEAMAKAVKDFPLINVSVDGTNIHIHKNVNINSFFT